MDTDITEEDISTYNVLTGKIVGAAIEVSNQLGAGFLEKVYERALLHELCNSGLTGQAQVALPVRYKGTPIATYVCDLVVEEKILVELKCVESVRSEHMAQCLNYLKASGLRICLLFNFQRPRLEWKRIAR